jgi:hypothetical protein
MKYMRRLVGPSLVLAAFVLAGCTATGPRADRADVAPGMIAPDTDASTHRMVLGAGDAWGRLIYVQYLASLERAEHADTAYAIVDTDAGAPE